MSKLVCILTVTMLAALTALPAASQTAIPDLRGTWKGESESLVLGGGNPHHPAAQPDEPQLRSVPFTLTVDQHTGPASRCREAPRPLLYHAFRASSSLQ
jgi:hypothetical protein